MIVVAAILLLTAPAIASKDNGAEINLTKSSFNFTFDNIKVETNNKSDFINMIISSIQVVDYYVVTSCNETNATAKCINIKQK